jgi:hypothetical protein
MNQAPRRPYIVLAAAIVLPGSGHVLNGQPHRGLAFLFFIILLGWASAHAMPAQFSFAGRYIGGIFIYGLSVIDAYKFARVRYEQWRYLPSTEKTSSALPPMRPPKE